MTDTIMPVAPYAHGGFGNQGYGNGDNCLSDVILANQLSSGFSDGIQATHNASLHVSNNTTQHALRNNDAINTARTEFLREIADVRVEAKSDHCTTQKDICELKCLLSSQHEQIKSEFLRQTNENLRTQLQALQSQLAVCNS